jgi:transposase
MKGKHEKKKNINRISPSKEDRELVKASAQCMVRGTKAERAEVISSTHRRRRKGKRAQTRVVRK